MVVKNVCALAEYCQKSFFTVYTLNANNSHYLCSHIVSIRYCIRRTIACLKSIRIVCLLFFNSVFEYSCCASLVFHLEMSSCPLMDFLTTW